jgi:hypothetical protein
MKSDFINCKNCVDDCHCKGKDITPICISFKPAKTTNADRIRAMTDEELAKWLNHMQTDAYNRGMLEDWIFGYPNNYDNWIEWLKEKGE